jgi:hypothetical protein
MRGCSAIDKRACHLSKAQVETKDALEARLAS